MCSVCAEDLLGYVPRKSRRERSQIWEPEKKTTWRTPEIVEIEPRRGILKNSKVKTREESRGREVKTETCIVRYEALQPSVGLFEEPPGPTSGAQKRSFKRREREADGCLVDSGTPQPSVGLFEEPPGPVIGEQRCYAETPRVARKGQIS